MKKIVNLTVIMLIVAVLTSFIPALAASSDSKQAKKTASHAYTWFEKANTTKIMANHDMWKFTAIRLQTEAIKQDPKNPDLYVALGKMYINNFNNDQVSGIDVEFEQAIDCFKKALDLNYKDPAEVYRLLIFCYTSTERYREGFEAVKSYYSLNSTLIPLDKILSILLYGGNLSDSTAILNRYDTKNSFVWANLYFRSGMYDETLQKAEEGTSNLLNDSNITNYQVSQYYNLIGAAYIQINQYDKALELLQKIDELNKTANIPYTAHYLNLYNCFLKLNRPDDALNYFNKINVNELDFRTAAYLYYQMGRYSMAEEIIKKNLIYKFGIQFEDIPDHNFHPLVYIVQKGSSPETARLEIGDYVTEIDGVSTKKLDKIKIFQLLSNCKKNKIKIKYIKTKISIGGNLFSKSGKTKLLENKEYTAVIERKTFIPSDVLADSYAMLSLTKRAIGDYTKSYNLAKSAMSANPASYYAKLAWGLTNLDQENYDKSMNALSGIEESNLLGNQRVYNEPLETTASFYSDIQHIKTAKALIFLKTGQIDNAVESLPEDAVNPEIAPLTQDCKIVLDGLRLLQTAYMNKARAYEKKCCYTQALSSAVKAYAIISDVETKKYIFNLMHKIPDTPAVPEEAREFVSQAEKFIAQKDYFMALEQYKKALKLAPYSATLYYNSAVICGEAKDYNNAVSYMKDYLAIAPKAPNFKSARELMIKWEILSGRYD